MILLLILFFLIIIILNNNRNTENFGNSWDNLLFGSQIRKAWFYNTERPGKYSREAAECYNLSPAACINNTNCGLCNDTRCVPGDVYGPLFTTNCENWTYKDSYDYDVIRKNRPDTYWYPEYEARFPSPTVVAGLEFQ